MITLPASGEYTLAARGTGAPGGKTYTFRLQETAQTNIAIGTPFTGNFVGSGQAQLFRINVPLNRPLRLRLSNAASGNNNEIYASFGLPPTRGVFDYRSTSGLGSNQELIIPSVYAGSWYILVYGDLITTPSDYALLIESADLFVTALTPTHSGNSGPASIDISGAGFDSAAQAWLINGGTSIPATNLFFVSSSRLVADFDLTSLPTNVYQLTVVQGTNSAALPFTVTEGPKAKLETRLVVPSRVGYHALATLYVEFQNTGDAAMPAPLLEVGATQNGRAGAWLTLTEHRLVEGFWTSATPEGFAHSVQFLASGATAGLLQPGESGRVPVYYAGWQQPWDWNYNLIYFNLGVLDADNTNLVDWAALKDEMRPSSLTAEQWEPVFWNLAQQTGGTWGHYIGMLNDNARYLHRLGIRVTDIRELLGFEVMQASGLSVTRTLASAVDAQVQTPGLPPTFTRSFSTDIPSHLTLGRLGRGWSDNWDRSRATNSDGTVIILGPGGSRRVFQPDSRTSGRYFAPAGDSATLTAAGGGTFTLRESDGTLYAFRSDGKLDYVADTHNDRVTCIYSGNVLTRLTHSAGPYLNLTYSGSRLTSVTDSQGRQTVFTYDGSGEHLQTARDYRNQTTTYQYDLSLLTSAATHALTNIVNADGTESHYEYDTYGRLIKKAGCCGSPECTTFSYDSAGRITATDALTNSTQHYFDHRGLLVRTENPLGGIVHRTFDPDGRLVRVTDAAGRSRDFSYDPRGNLSSETDALGYPTRYTYTADFNRLASVLDAKGNLTRYAYEPDGDLASISYPDGSHEDWTYDSHGNRVSWTNRRRQTITYTNDVLGRVIARRYPDGVVHTFNYDPQGNVAGYTDPLGTTTQEFDAGGRLAKITYPGNRWLAYTYDAAGRMALKTLGNGVYTTYAYDPAGQLLDLFNRKPGGSVLSRFQYTYDNRGRRDTMTTTYGVGDPRTSLAGLWRYNYDDTGQLIGWTAPWGRRVDYTYDALGNRLNVRDNGTNTAYTVNNLNQYTQAGSTTYQYDADGNLTNKVAPEGTTSYGWSPDNNLLRLITSSQVSEWIRDAHGRVALSYSNGVVGTYTYEGSRLIAEQDGSHGAGMRSYVYDFGLLGRKDDREDAKFYTYDVAGNASEVIGHSPGFEHAYSYGPYGDIEAVYGDGVDIFTAGARHGFIGLASGLLSIGAIVYNPILGSILNPQIVIPIAPPQIWPVQPIQTVPPYTPTPPPPRPEHNCRYEDMGPPDCKIDEMAVPDYINCKWHCLSLPDPPDNGGGEPPEPADCPNGEWRTNPDGTRACIPHVPPPQPPSPPDWCVVHPEWCMCYEDMPMCYYVPPTPPIDPNALTGPKGFGSQNYVPANALLPYTVEFENATNALVPAQQVVVSDRLTNRLDWTTFELTEISFGDQFIAVPPHTQHFETSKQLSVNSCQFVVEIEAGIHLDTGEVYARFQSLNPTNGLPPSGPNSEIIGFLPPEDGTGRGQGHISYVIRAHTNLVTGTEIRNVAWITFDQQPAIATDWFDPDDPSKGIDTNKQALVTIDADAPSSAVASLPATTPLSLFTVSWGGSDVGTGVASYDVYVSTNNGPWAVWLGGVSYTSATFMGQCGQTYGFASTVRDQVGNTEALPGSPDTSIAVDTNCVTDFRLSIARSPISGGEGEQITLTHPVLPGQNHVIEYRDDLGDGGTWTNLPGAPHNTGSVVETNVLSQRFYRVRISNP